MGRVSGRCLLQHFADEYGISTNRQNGKTETFWNNEIERALCAGGRIEMKDFVKLSTSLCASCLIAAIALALVHAFTAGPIAEQRKKEELAAVKKTLPVYDNDPVADKKQ